MKYDLSGLSLRIDGSYQIGFFSTTETGTYTVAAGATSFGSASFSNLPNQRIARPMALPRVSPG